MQMYRAPFSEASREPTQRPTGVRGALAKLPQSSTDVRGGLRREWGDGEEEK